MARLPRNRRVEHPPPMRLTERDVTILKAVHDFRVLRGDQIQALFFNSQSTASYRLSRLYQHGFVERHFLPTLGGLASSPTLYTLTKRGGLTIREAFELEPEELKRQLNASELSPLFMEHLLKINDVRVAVVLAARHHGYTLEMWLDDKELKADYDRMIVETARGRKREVSLIPDGYFSLQVPQGRACFFLELDRGTMTVGRFKTKVQAYLAYIASGQYERRHKSRSLRVLTVTSGTRRLANLLRVTAETGGGRVFWFTGFAEVTPKTVLDSPIWQVVGSTASLPLIGPPSNYRALSPFKSGGTP